MRSLVQAPTSVEAVAGRGSETAQPESWRRLEVLLAVVGTVLIATRIVILPQLLLTAGDVLAVALVPLWFPVTRRYLGARLVLLLGVLAVLAGALLTAGSADDHPTSTGGLLLAISLVFGTLACFGFLLWAREKVSDAVLGSAFGFGLLIGVSQTSALYSANPWRFGFSVPVAVLVLGLCAVSRSRWLALIATLALTLVSALTDARSSFALLLLTAALLTWQLRPRQTNRRSSALRALLGLGLFGAIVYNIGQSLIVNGYLGAITQQRSVQQINETGSLILGGRPELTATLALMRDHPMGFGSGTRPNHHDITVAKEGMASIGYDPDNGYVDNWMFGHGFALHSVTGDLWVQSGLVGLVLAATILFLTLRGVSRRVSVSAASALLLYVGFKTIWNLFFSPFYSSISLLELSLALTLIRRTPDPGPAVGSEDDVTPVPAETG